MELSCKYPPSELLSDARIAFRHRNIGVVTVTFTDTRQPRTHKHDSLTIKQDITVQKQARAKNQWINPRKPNLTDRDQAESESREWGSTSVKSSATPWTSSSQVQPVLFIELRITNHNLPRVDLQSVRRTTPLSFRPSLQIKKKTLRDPLRKNHRMMTNVQIHDCKTCGECGSRRTLSNLSFYFVGIVAKLCNYNFRVRQGLK